MIKCGYKATVISQRPNKFEFKFKTTGLLQHTSVNYHHSANILECSLKYLKIDIEIEIHKKYTLAVQFSL